MEPPSNHSTAKAFKLLHGELRIVLAGKTFITEVAPDFKHAVNASHQEPFQIQFQRNAQIEIAPKRIVMSDERLSRRPPGNRLHHRCLNLHKSARHQKIPYFSHNLTAFEEHILHCVVGHQIQITLTISDFRIRQAMQIGSLQLKSRLFLSPLAGYTNLPFRLTLREIGGLDLATTDLVNARSLLEKKSKALKLIETCAEDRPLAVQLFGSVPEEMRDAAVYLESIGISAVDINMSGYSIGPRGSTAAETVSERDATARSIVVFIWHTFFHWAKTSITTRHSNREF